MKNLNTIIQHHITLVLMIIYLKFLKTTQFFSVISLNIECLSAKFDKLCAFLQVLSDSNIHFSAIAIQETWTPENFDYSFYYSIPGYNAICQGYVCGKKVDL